MKKPIYISPHNDNISTKRINSTMINLFYNYYTDKNDYRNSELVYCLDKNINNKHIDKIYIIGDVDELDITGDNIQIIDHKKVPTFKFVFEQIKLNTEESDINIIMNTDCYIEEDDMYMLDKLKPENSWCLARQDISSIDPFTYQRRISDCSQDCWIFHGHPNIENVDFQFGRAGCDNRLSYEFNACGLTPLNPSISFRVYHYHISDIRTTFGSGSGRERNRVHGNYKMLDPIKYNDIV